MNKIFFILFFISLTNCKNSNSKIKINDITNSFKLVEKDSFYFDLENNIPFKSKIIKDVGLINIYFIPNNKNEIDFCQKINFEKKYDELNDIYYFSEKSKMQIDSIYKKKGVNGYKIICTYVESNYIEIDSFSLRGEFSIIFPHKMKIYKKVNQNWEYIKDKEIKNYDDDINFYKVLKKDF